MPPAGDEKRPKRASPERGVLSSLPSTRPQRPSARRAAARSSATKDSVPTKRSKPSKPAAPPKRTTRAPQRESAADALDTRSDPAAARKRARTRAGARRATEDPPIPRQGFETEEEIAPGSTVNPPSRPELAAAVADLLGELAQGGLTAGGRLLKEVLGRLPGA